MLEIKIKGEYELPSYISKSDIQVGWQSVLEKQNQDVFTKVPLYNGPLYNCLDISSSKQEEIQVQTGLDYQTIIGLRNNSTWMDKNINNKDIPLALSVFTVLVTSDDHMVLKKRLGGDWEDSFEIPGGFVAPDEGTINESIESLLHKNFSRFKLNVCDWKYVGRFVNKKILEYPFVITLNVPVHSKELIALDQECRALPLPHLEKKEKYSNSNLKIHSPSIEAMKYICTLQDLIKKTA